MLDLAEVSLEDKFTHSKGRVIISGVQALLRLPMIQRDLDQKAGLTTAGFITGYRGSPLGGLDSAAMQESKRLAAHDIHFLPGVNEDLAATSIWGTQQLDAMPGARVDGVFAMWYGKGPGVERSADVIRHGNSAGSHSNGGVLLVYGDDHPGKSSTIAHQSEKTLAALSVPSLYPANVHEFLRFGLLGWAMSRYTGLWTGFKCVNETVEQTSTISLDKVADPIVFPDLPNDLPVEGLNINPRTFNPAGAEQIVMRHRLPLVHRFVRANKIDFVAKGNETPRFGIVTAGKSYEDTKRALAILGVDDTRMQELNLGLWKVGCIWPLEPAGLRAFASQAQALLFVEEKKPVIEDQARAILYDTPKRPVIWGKKDNAGSTLLPSDTPFDPIEAARALYLMLRDAQATDQALDAAFKALAPVPSLTKPERRGDTRMPYFCSGCPHSISTRLPDGSFAMSGIGCHTMVVYNGKGTTLPPTQMGGEGANWIGLAPFTNTKHIFQNLGDGTYYHSGLLAIRAAVAANVNITYKILYNDAVAMTGGQPIDGPISVADMAQQVLAEGVKSCVVVSEDPQALDPDILPPGVNIYHRDELNEIQSKLRHIEGVTALIFQQTCAAEKRRRRKRGLMEDPNKRIFINEAVCEGCGDCSVQSGCISILPKITALGIKRQIDQSSCNKDFSCIKGFCPSFITVKGAKLRKPAAATIEPGTLKSIPAPTIHADNTHSVMIAGIGGTGVVTVGAVLSMAAHMEGKAASVYDMTGLAQKNGAVFSHLRFAPNVGALGPQRLGENEADLVLAFDAMAATDPEVLKTIRRDHSQILTNDNIAPSAFFQMDASETGLPDSSGILEKLQSSCGTGKMQLLDANRLALKFCGNSIAINMIMIGYAYQSGHLPLSSDAIEQAIKLNGVAVEFNQRAFRIGRLLASAPEKLGIQNAQAKTNAPSVTLNGLLEFHARLLTDYQSAAWADRYCKTLHALELAEQEKGLDGLALAAAPVLSRLMRYKDEYEVARLYSDQSFKIRIAEVFEGEPKIEFNFAPPVFSKIDARTGRPKKRSFGSWMFTLLRILSGLRKLRGTPFDIFGYSAERRTERQLISWYEGIIKTCISDMQASTQEDWKHILSLPDSIRGFGPVKEKNQTRIQDEIKLLLGRL